MSNEPTPNGDAPEEPAGNADASTAAQSDAGDTGSAIAKSVSPKLLERLLGPTFDLLGAELYKRADDWLKGHRLENSREHAKRASFSRPTLIEEVAERVEPEVVAGWLEGAGRVSPDDPSSEELSDLWQGLLLQAADGDRGHTRRLLACLRDLSPEEASMLVRMDFPHDALWGAHSPGLLDPSGAPKGARSAAAYLLGHRGGGLVLPRGSLEWHVAEDLTRKGLAGTPGTWSVVMGSPAARAGLLWAGLLTFLVAVDGTGVPPLDEFLLLVPTDVRDLGVLLAAWTAVLLFSALVRPLTREFSRFALGRAHYIPTPLGRMLVASRRSVREKAEPIRPAEGQRRKRES